MFNLTITDEDIKNSRAAVQNYMAFRPSNNSRHEAWVTASSVAHKSHYHGVLYVCPQIKGKTASIIIEGNAAYFNYDLESEYTDMDAKFRFINNALIISTTDRFGNKAEVDVSRK